MIRKNEPGAVVIAPKDCVIEMHGKGRFGIVRRLDAANRPPVRFSERAAIYSLPWKFLDGDT